MIVREALRLGVAREPRTIETKQPAIAAHPQDAMAVRRDAEDAVFDPFARPVVGEAALRESARPQIGTDPQRAVSAAPDRGHQIARQSLALLRVSREPAVAESG